MCKPVTNALNDAVTFITNAFDSLGGKPGPAQPNQAVVAEQRAAEQKRRDLANQNAILPSRANAANALYGSNFNPIREGGSPSGTASTGITTSGAQTKQTALTLGKSDLLGQ
jgi:hypothetical protein